MRAVAEGQERFGAGGGARGGGVGGWVVEAEGVEDGAVGVDGWVGVDGVAGRGDHHAWVKVDVGVREV